MPSHVVHTTYTRYQPGEVTPVQKLTYSLLDVELAPRLPLTAFSTDTDSLPQGVRVWDQVDGAELTVGEGPASKRGTRRAAGGADRKDAKSTEQAAGADPSGPGPAHP